MKVKFIRFNRSTQFLGTGFNSAPIKETFSFFTVVTVGWESGARSRCRNFHELPQIEAYLRKLNEGGWLSDTHYSEALGLLQSFGFIG